MNLKAILCDFDGTLVDNNLNYNPGIKNLVAYFRSKKVHFSLATGQPNYSFVRNKLTELDIEDYHIFHGGALIRQNKSNEILWSQFIPQTSLLKVLQYFKQKNINYALETTDHSYFFKDEPDQNYLPKERVKLASALDNYSNVLKILLTPRNNRFSEGTVDYHRKNLNSICKDLTFSKFFYKFHGLDITSEKATKHTAVLEYEKLLNIPRQEIIAIGDDHNDYPMFTACGYNIAMENAPADLKKISDFIAPTVQNNGTVIALKHIIEKFL